jgi:hypothetical protein
VLLDGPIHFLNLTALQHGLCLRSMLLFTAKVCYGTKGASPVPKYLHQ